MIALLNLFRRKPKVNGAHIEDCFVPTSRKPITEQDLVMHDKIFGTRIGFNRLNNLFHVQMHREGAVAEVIIAEATKLLDMGVEWDEAMILNHIGGFSIHARCKPTRMEATMLRFVHGRGVSLAPLREHAERCQNIEWLALIRFVEAVNQQSVIVIEECQEVISHDPINIAEHLREFGSTGCGKLPTLVAAEQRRGDGWRRKGKRPARKGR